MYSFFKINTRFSKNNYYLSLLPKYRSSPVFIFDENGKILFGNTPAKEILPDILSIDDLKNGNCSKVNIHNKEEKIIYRKGDNYFQTEMIALQNEDLTLAYLIDVTEVIKLNEAIEETQKEVIYAMGELGETRSKETGNHVKRVALYSRTLALLYGLDVAEADKLHMASPMHDIGKVGIPDAILNAPRKLTADEFTIMKTHAELGYDMLKHSDKAILKAAAIVAGEHHEKWDGSGYPNGKSGEDIHIYGRITAVADVFDALGSERIYKKAWELDKILDLFKEERGKHFDPDLVDLFINNLDSFLTTRDKFQDIYE
jgi:response regulator RpfG family c-di-GMP phosphodiesterase